MRRAPQRPGTQTLVFILRGVARSMIEFQFSAKKRREEKKQGVKREISRVTTTRPVIHELKNFERLKFSVGLPRKKYFFKRKSARATSALHSLHLLWFTPL